MALRNAAWKLLLKLLRGGYFVSTLTTHRKVILTTEFSEVGICDVEYLCPFLSSILVNQKLKYGLVPKIQENQAVPEMFLVFSETHPMLWYHFKLFLKGWKIYSSSLIHCTGDLEGTRLNTLWLLKPLLESTGTDLHTNGFHGEETADWGGMNSPITEVFFFPAQNKNALTRQKSQLSTQRSSEWTGAFVRGGVWSWIPAAATFTVRVDSHGFQHLWREL